MADAGLPRTQLLQALLWSLVLPINHPSTLSFVLESLPELTRTFVKPECFMAFGKNQSASIAEQCHVSTLCRVCFPLPRLYPLLAWHPFPPRSLNGTLQVSHRTAGTQPQFALLTYIVRGTAYLNLDSFSDEVFWLSNTSLMLFKIFWQMGKLFQSDLSNTLLQYFAT